MTPEVTKIPYDISAATQNFDITKLNRSCMLRLHLRI
jgi:hypothetical protein